jgi:hypothetical protein
MWRQAGHAAAVLRLGNDILLPALTWPRRRPWQTQVDTLMGKDTQMTLTPSAPVRLGLIGTGWIGSFHAQSIVRRIPGAALAAVADPAPGAERLAGPVGVESVLRDPAPGARPAML